MSKGSQATAPSIWTGARSVPEAEAFIAAILKHVRRKLPFLAIWIGAFIACGLFYATVVKPEYIATAQILLQPRVIVNDGPEDLRHFYQLLIDGEQCETELRVLSSEQLLYRVFKALNLERSAEIRTGPDGFWSYLGAKVDQIERIVAPKQESLQAFYAFSDRVRSRRLGLSYVIEISYRAQSAKRATTVVNSIASAYAAYRLRGRLLVSNGGVSIWRGGSSHSRSRSWLRRQACVSGPCPRTQWPIPVCACSDPPDFHSAAFIRSCCRYSPWLSF